MLGELAEAAHAGIVHRDLKPENVLLTADGAREGRRLRDREGDRPGDGDRLRTTTGQIMGTPAYMAPEQATGGEITPQADLYATGVIAYELLAGRHPHPDCDAPMALLMRHVNGEPEPLGQVRPDLRAASWTGWARCSPRTRRPVPPAPSAPDRLDDVLCDALGPALAARVRLPEPGAAPEPVADIDPDPPTEIGFVTVVAPPVRRSPWSPPPSRRRSCSKPYWRRPRCTQGDRRSAAPSRWCSRARRDRVSSARWRRAGRREPARSATPAGTGRPSRAGDQKQPRRVTRERGASAPPPPPPPGGRGGPPPRARA